MTTQDDALPTALDPLREAPERFSLFAALRVIEASYPQRPRLGEARRARDEPVRLRQPPHLHFPPGPVADFVPAAPGRAPRLAYLACRSADAPPQLFTYAFGLFGPQGPLPLHVSREALLRARQNGDPTLARFCDVFHHRMLTLYWRAYAGARPAVQQDRPGRNRFRHRMAAFAGQPAGTPEGLVPARFFLFAAGLLALQTRPPEALARLVALWFRVPARVQEFMGGWLDIPARSRTHLGGGARLGRDTVLGTRSWQRQHRFRLVLGPLTLPQLLGFLPVPGGRGLPQLRALVARLPGIELEWDAQLLLRREEVPGTRLNGGSHLNWTTWLLATKPAQDAGDVVLQGG